MGSYGGDGMWNGVGMEQLEAFEKKKNEALTRMERCEIWNTDKFLP